MKMQAKPEVEYDMDRFGFSTAFQPSPDDNYTSSSAQKETKNQSQAADKPNLIQDFGSYTTLHGFHFTIDSTSRIRRFIWLCLLIGGLGLFLRQFKRNLDKLNANQLVISKSVEFARALPLPAVTICNQNMMRKSQIIGTVAQDYLDQLDALKFVAGQKPKDLPSFDMEETLQKAGHQIQDMLIDCRFAGDRVCSVKNNGFVPTISSGMHGLCYTFPANRSALNKVGPGKYDGLKLQLNAEPYEYYGPYSYHATGFKIAIHEPDTHHDIDNEGYDISPGFYTSMRIKRKKRIYLPAPFR